MAVPNGASNEAQTEISANGERKTRVLPVHTLNSVQDNKNLAELWDAEYKRGSTEAKALLEAAEALRTSDIPVAFPTETVYGLGADATRSAAVQGIYKAKQRPSDNPLIVHVSSREQLERLLKQGMNSSDAAKELVPQIYEPLISKFWPGPLTIILPNPPKSPLAPEVTSSLSTFGVRMPSSPLARLLIRLTDRPIAAPSANASTKPSPTTAQHVYTDMHGRIDLILDGGPCGVGVESTVVDGLTSPPSILRPGGIGIEEIRACPGWEDVQIGYKDGALKGKEAPRAPGMKYRHYSPKAKVVLFEAGKNTSLVTKRVVEDLGLAAPRPRGYDSSQRGSPRIGVVRTRLWNEGLNLPFREHDSNGTTQATTTPYSPSHLRVSIPTRRANDQDPSDVIDMFDIPLGSDTENIARGLFSSLRSLDEKNVSIIYVEGVSDTEGDLAAAIMNRLRKAAEEEVKG